MPRRAAKIDGTQTAIVETLRALGAEVVSLAPLGGGVPDLLVWLNGRFYLVECKTPKGKLRPKQEQFMQKWPVQVLRSVEDAEELCRMGRVPW